MHTLPRLTDRALSTLTIHTEISVISKVGRHGGEVQT